MAKSRPFSDANPDLRRRPQCPSPPVAEVERQLWQWLSPATFKPTTGVRNTDDKRLRNRILTLPVMVAVVLSLVYRQINGLSELLRVLQMEGLLWVEPMALSRTALDKRFRSLPVSLLSQLLTQVQAQLATRPTGTVLSEPWQALQSRFPAIWIADGSTLEELRRQLKAWRGHPSTLLAGKLMMVVELFSHRPVAMQYDEKAKANDKAFGDWLLTTLPVGGLLVFDLGFFAFPWFDQFTETGRYFVTRQREKTAHTRQRVLSRGERYCDEIIVMGQYRSNPCRHPVRMVSVQWGTTWYRYLTNVLDPEHLSAQQVCDLYRRRWRIEEAFCVTKRLLGLAYVWVGDTNGIQIQIVATWMFYAVLNDLCAQVAIALHQPIEKISLEMVFRGLYHYSRARLHDDTTELIPFYQQHHQLLGLVKATRKRHRQYEHQWAEVWGNVPGCCPVVPP
ncbi:IS4 family transposase [Nodosilinea sp. LEGE 06152]|uniref:IS4 family transposase n=1 Tax=Nodosilinea sp. LEGE 06152 TaxID=2777966 RepID=UPI0018805F8C|nr:IS4 family transposase [Nodosilinea sp. LEGE 06152]MBE9155850.1 IS4 family transposase [Nodosilinea sp. LEGE 06152]